MRHRIFPFSVRNDFTELSDLKTTIESKLEQSNQNYLNTKNQSNRDYSTNEMDNDRQELTDIITEFQHILHGINVYKFLSDNLLYFKFHSELENQPEGLIARYYRYNEHFTRVKSPPRFKKPFFAYFKDEKKGILFAPSGSPKTVNYICDKNIHNLLHVNFQREKTFSSTEIERLFTLINSDTDRVEGISMITANIVSKGSRQRQTITLTNLRDFNQFQNLKKNNTEFHLDAIEFYVKYGDGKRAKLMLYGCERSPSISTTLSSRNVESKKEFYEWLGNLYTNLLFT